MNLQATSFAERVSAHVDRSDELLDEIRRAATYLRVRQSYALWKLQIVTGLHKNSLLRLQDRHWIPKPTTMVALAKLVERAQAHRRGESFEFPERRGPGRPPVYPRLPLAMAPARKPGRSNGTTKKHKGSKRKTKVAAE